MSDGRGFQLQLRFQFQLHACSYIWVFSCSKFFLFYFLFCHAAFYFSYSVPVIINLPINFFSISDLLFAVLGFFLHLPPRAQEGCMHMHGLVPAAVSLVAN
jgi:hypothetical protein